MYSYASPESEATVTRAAAIRSPQASSRSSGARTPATLAFRPPLPVRAVPVAATPVIKPQEGVQVQRQAVTGTRTAAAPTLAITGVIAAGGALDAETILAVNAAAQQLSKNRRYVAYEKYVKVGGSLAWRFNNPGSLRNAATKIAEAPGASGTFAVFASMEEGRAAQRSLYLNTYGKWTVRKAISKLTPPSENDTAAYLAALQKGGINLDGTVESQIDALMVQVHKNEGTEEGIVVPRAGAAAVTVPLYPVPYYLAVPDATRVAPR